MEVRHWIGISTPVSRNIALPVWPEVTLGVIRRSNIDIILKIQHFERRIQRAGSMTFKVTLKVTEVYLGLLSWTLAHMHRRSRNSEKSVPKCREVLFLAFLIDLGKLSRSTLNLLGNFQNTLLLTETRPKNKVFYSDLCVGLIFFFFFFFFEKCLDTGPLLVAYLAYWLVTY